MVCIIAIDTIGVQSPTWSISVSPYRSTVPRQGNDGIPAERNCGLAHPQSTTSLRPVGHATKHTSPEHLVLLADCLQSLLDLILAQRSEGCIRTLLPPCFGPTHNTDL